MNSHALSVPRSRLFIEAGLKAKIVGFSDEAYGRFRSATQAAEGVLDHLLMVFTDLPPFEVIFADIYLLVGFHEISGNFFVDSCCDLRENPESMPGKAGSSTVFFNVLLPAASGLTNIETLAAPQADLLINNNVKYKLRLLSKEAHARFLSAKLHAEAALRRLVNHLNVLPILKIEVEGIILMVGFHRQRERFFISDYFILGENPGSPDHPPGNGLPVTVMVTITVMGVGLALSIGDEEDLQGKRRTLNFERGSNVGIVNVGIVGDGDDRSLRLITEVSVAGNFDYSGIVRTDLMGISSSSKPTSNVSPGIFGDALVLGVMSNTCRRSDSRLGQHAHSMTCALTGTDEGLGGIIPNLLDYSGSAFVLDLKGANYTATARGRRSAGQRVILIDPFGITGACTNAWNWLDSLDLQSPDLVSITDGLADMLIVAEGAGTDSHWNHTAKELLRGLLIYVAGLPTKRRTMVEVRRLVTASKGEFADTMARMQADPERGQGVPARAAAAYLNRPERERASVLSTIIRHTAWLDDPRLCAALARSDFNLADLNRQSMTVYLAIPPDRLHASLGFVRGIVGLALEGVTATTVWPAHRAVFFLDEFGQLRRRDRLLESVTLLQSYGLQLFVAGANLSRTRAMYSSLSTRATVRSDVWKSPGWRSNLSESLVANLCSRRWPGAGATTWKEHPW